MGTDMLNLCSCSIIQSGEEHRTHVDGTFYKKPQKFPCVFHDRRGCLCLSSERYLELVKAGIIRESKGGAITKVNIKNSISKISEYSVCTERTKCPVYNPKNPNSTSKMNQKNDPATKLFARICNLPLEQRKIVIDELFAMQKH